MSSVRARVFISCGQATDQEKTVAADVARRLEEVGFDSYVALQVQTLSGLKEAIFGRLAESEYFVFIDFARERLRGREQQRGSLFSHQEFAVAAYLDIDAVVLCEKGVERNGVLNVVQANPVMFSDRQHLPAIVVDEVKKRGWRADWRNELTMMRDSPATELATRVERDAFGNTQQYPASFFQIPVRNLHRSKLAANCYAYLESILNEDTNERVQVNTIEFKWAGYTQPNAVIMPNSARYFDAFFLGPEPVGAMAQSPGFARPRFNVFTDSTKFIPKIQSAGRYQFIFQVVSESFAPARGTFRAVFGEDPKAVSLSSLDPDALGR